MVDSLQVAVVVIVIFVVILATEILFSFCRLYHWIRRKVDGDVDPSMVPPGRYRRSSISHNWSEASVERAKDVFSGHEDSYDGKNFNATNDVAATNDLNAFKDRDGLFQHHRQLESNRMFLSEADILISDKSYSGERSYATKIESSQVDMSLHRRRRASSAGPPSDRILLASDFIKTVELEWASGQFVCHHCKTSLSGQRYILHEDRSYCRKCYEKLYANICDKCKTPITCDFKDLSCKNRHWHDKCFRCSGCLTFLIEKPFAYKDHQLYCASCYESRFAARCTLCRNIFRAGMKKYEYKGRQWHAECFCCRACQKLIGTNSFIPRGQDVMCVPCYEKQLGQNCFRCHKVISRGGVIYKNSTWHRECFQCSHCHKSLSNEKYTSVDQRPFCVRCYGDLYAKKCDHCKGAITGIDEPSFISFNQHHYHSLCFRCSKCDKALFGKGFMTEQDKIFCPDCCKEA